jgi:hypothetical protein
MMQRIRQLISASILVVSAAAFGGCQASQLIGGMAQTHEYQKKVEVTPKYAGLENKTVAVLVDADLSTLYENPGVVANIAGGVSGRIQQHVPGVKVLSPNAIINWQYRTPQWNALPYGELAQQLNVDRVIHVDLLEYRLNPPGNRWLWEGVCLGRVSIIERDGLDPDTFSQTFDLNAKFPNISGVGRESANQAQIQTGLLAQFIEKTAWLFYQHQEPKYPDKYRPELERPKKKA